MADERAMRAIRLANEKYHLQLTTQEELVTAEIIEREYADAGQNDAPQAVPVTEANTEQMKEFNALLERQVKATEEKISNETKWLVSQNRRDRFTAACAAMTGLVSEWVWEPKEIARASVEMSDALMAALAKE